MPSTDPIRRAEYQREWKQRAIARSPKIPCGCGCGELMPSLNWSGRPRRFINGHGRKGVPAKAGDTCTDERGYVHEYDPQAKRFVLQHRLVWIRANGPIEAGLVLHHKNRDRSDNRIENLELLTNSEHMRLHWAEDHEARRARRIGRPRGPNYRKRGYEEMGKRAVSYRLQEETIETIANRCVRLGINRTQYIERLVEADVGGGSTHGEVARVSHEENAADVSPFSGTPGAPSAAGGSWGNSGGTPDPDSEAEVQRVLTQNPDKSRAYAEALVRQQRKKR